MKRRLYIVPCATLLLVGALQAQTPPRVELRPFVGGFIPLQPDVYREAYLLGLGGGMELDRQFTIVGSFGWSPGTMVRTVSPYNVNTYIYDLGLERAFHPAITSTDWEEGPFAGAGIGGHTYDYKDPSLATKTFFSGYLSLGEEMQLRRISLRLEGRLYGTQFQSPTANSHTTMKTDLAILSGLAWHLR